MADDDNSGSSAGDEFQDELPGAVLATTDQPVALQVREIEDERVPEGMHCLGTFLDGTLVARCAVPPGALEFFDRYQVFQEPRQLVLAAREEDPGLRCELYAIVPMPEPPPEVMGEDEEREPWANSVPSSNYENAVAELEFEEEQGPEDDDGQSNDELEEGPVMAAVLLGQIIRFEKDRRHPDSLPLETVDVLARIVSGRVVEVVDKVLRDLLGPS